MFATEEFKINELGIQILKNSQVYKSIDFVDLQTVEFKYGPQTKYPIRTLLFGLILITISNSIFYYFGPFHFEFPTNHPKAQIAGLMIYASLMLMGLSALYLVVIRTRVLVLKLNNGNIEVLQLKKLNKENSINDLILFLQGRVIPNRIQINL